MTTPQEIMARALAEKFTGLFAPAMRDKLGAELAQVAAAALESAGFKVVPVSIEAEPEWTVAEAGIAALVRAWPSFEGWVRAWMGELGCLNPQNAIPPEPFEAVWQAMVSAYHPEGSQT